MEANSKNNIRPITLRIVNPTPKTGSVKGLKEESAKEIRQEKKIVSFAFFMLLGLLLFFLLSHFGILKHLDAGSTWRTFSIRALLFLFPVFLLPLFFYFLIYPFTLKELHFRFDTLSALLCLILGFPLAYIVTILNFLCSLLFLKLNLTDQVWTATSFSTAFNLNNPLQLFLYIIIFCILSALIYEFALRPVLLLPLVSKPLSVKSRTVLPVLCNALLSALLVFETKQFLPYFIFGFFAASLYLTHRNLISALLFQLSFACFYQLLIPRITWLRINVSAATYRSLEDYLPLTFRLLVAATLFVPLLIILKQFRKPNPLLRLENKANRGGMKKEPLKPRLFYLSLIGILIIYLLIV